jgi:hypothetical protein
MKVKKTFFVLLIFLFCAGLSAQNLLGYKLVEVKRYMRENQKSMAFQGLTFNNTFKYAKYVDRDGNQTSLFFFTADSVCKGIRMICDKSIEAQMVKDLDSKFKKDGKNKWQDNRDGRTYAIELREEEYSFSVTISVKNQD